MVPYGGLFPIMRHERRCCLFIKSSQKFGAWPTLGGVDSLRHNTERPWLSPTSTIMLTLTGLLYKGVFIATQLNWPSWTAYSQVSCFCLWLHDLQIESTGSLRSLIGDSCSRCERVDNSTSSWVELCRCKHPLTALNVHSALTVE